MTFEEFAAARLPGVLRFAGVLTADRALAEDVVQEVLIRVHARWDRIGAMDRPELYGGWCPQAGARTSMTALPKTTPSLRQSVPPS
jgi:Sigma-70 region 2